MLPYSRTAVARSTWKLLSLYLIFLCSASTIQAQISPFPNQGATWTTAIYGFFGLYSASPIEYVNTGDTTINGHNYSIVGEGLFRDSLDVWYCLSPDDQSELAYFNFNLIEGDTMFVTNPFLEPDALVAPYVIVSAVDSVQLLNDQYAKRMQLSYDTDTTHYEGTWIAGIGDLNGLFNFGQQYYIWEDSPWEQLVCFYDDELLYENPVSGTLGATQQPIFYEACNWYVGIEEIDNNIQVYPNPVDDIVHLQGSIFQGDVEIQIMDMYGSKVYQWTGNLTKNQLDIDLPPHLPNGVYFLNVITSNQETMVRVLKY